MPRLTIELEDEERVALQLMAKSQRRDARAQAAILVRRGLESTGMLPLEAAVKNQSRSRIGSASNE
jgi:hypothetical protein